MDMLQGYVLKERNINSKCVPGVGGEIYWSILAGQIVEIKWQACLKRGWSFVG